MGVNNYRLAAGDGSPLLIPGERREVIEEAAAKLRHHLVAAAAELGFDKVSTAVVLVDCAVRLMSQNDPPYPPETVRESVERAIVHHYSRR